MNTCRIAAPPQLVLPLPGLDALPASAAAAPTAADGASIRRRNPRHQGDIGVGAAIEHFATAGHRVFVPLSESQRYALVVDDGTGL